MDLSELHLHWRESKYKGNKYRSYSLARPYRLNGKNRKEIVMKLGKLSDEEVNKWREILRAFKNPDSFLTTLEDIITPHHYACLDVAAVNAVWNEWGIDYIFQDNGRRDVSIATVTRILTINRCINPAAKSNIPQWFQSTVLPWLLNVDISQINPSRIFRELVNIENHKEVICKYLFTTMSRNNPDSMKSIFYDLSSTTFSGKRCILVKYGHCKEVDPVFVWTDIHVKAHYTICVLSYLINQTLTLRLHKHKGNATKEIVSHERFYQELSGCSIDRIEIKNVQKSKYSLTCPTNKQIEALNRVGLKHLLEDTMPKNLNISK